MPTKPPTHNPLPPFLQKRVAEQRATDKERRRKEYESQEGRAADRAFYSSKRWTKFRNYLLGIIDEATNIPKYSMCQECLKLGRIKTAGVQIDHIKPRKERPDLAFDEDNCQGLCRECHGKKTRAGQ